MDKKLEEALIGFKDVFDTAKRAHREEKASQSAYLEVCNQWNTLHAAWVSDTISEDQMKEYHHLSKEKARLGKTCDILWDRRYQATTRMSEVWREIKALFETTYLSEYVKNGNFRLEE